MRWTAHWLAVEGVMPRVPENVLDLDGDDKLSTDATASSSKRHLSLELQLYFSRLTASLLPPVAAPSAHHPAEGESTLSDTETARLAALASLRGDTGLQGLVVYLVRWIAEKTLESLNNLSQLAMVLDVILAVLENPVIFIEPYVGHSHSGLGKLSRR